MGADFQLPVQSGSPLLLELVAREPQHLWGRVGSSQGYPARDRCPPYTTANEECSRQEKDVPSLL